MNKINNGTIFRRLSSSGVEIGTIVSLPLCGILSATSYGWPLIFMSMGGLSFCAAVPWYFFACNSPQQHKSITQRERDYIQKSLKTDDRSLPIPWKSIVTSLPMWALIITHIGSSWGFITMFLETPTYMNNIFKFDARKSGLYSALPYVMAWIMSVSFSRICDILYEKKYMSIGKARKLFNSIGCFSAAIGFSSLSFISSTGLAMATLVISMGLFSVTSSGYVINHMDLAPNFAGVMFGITNCMATGIANFAPITAGIILGDKPEDITRWRTVFFVAAAVVSFGNIFFLFLGSGEIQPWNEVNMPLDARLEINDSLERAIEKKDISKKFKSKDSEKSFNL